MNNGFDKKTFQQKSSYWANRLAAFLFLGSVITLFIVPFNTQVPTKWTFSGEPSQFVSAWLAVLIIPGVVLMLSAVMTNWSGWVSNTPTERRVVVVVSIFAAITLSVCHGLIIWGAIARA